MDAYVYAKAKALLINGQPKRTVNWIEQSKLLQCYYNCTTVGNINDEADYKYDDIYNNDNSKNHIKRRAEQLKSLQVESLLLSA